MSFGIICYRFHETKKEIEYLMIQRRNSLAFMEFIRGKYDLYNFEYVKHLMSYMTQTEQDMLLTFTFDDLWNNVWYQPFMPKQTQEYLDAKEKFLMLKEGIPCLKDGREILVRLKYLLGQSFSIFKEPEWGFPKGRRRLRERDVDCAMREFYEETGIVKSDVVLDSDQVAYEEIFYGTNNIKYRHVYYIAKMINNKLRDIVVDDINNPMQAREVSQVKWFTSEQVLQRIHEHNIERKVLFMHIVDDIEKKHKKSLDYTK